MGYEKIQKVDFFKEISRNLLCNSKTSLSYQEDTNRFKNWLVMRICKEIFWRELIPYISSSLMSSYSHIHTGLGMGRSFLYSSLETGVVTGPYIL